MWLERGGCGHRKRGGAVGRGVCCYRINVGVVLYIASSRSSGFDGCPGVALTTP